jgi:hypothetical protein
MLSTIQIMVVVITTSTAVTVIPTVTNMEGMMPTPISITTAEGDLVVHPTVILQEVRTRSAY